MANSALDSRSITIPGRAVRVGGIFLALLLSVGSLWVTMKSELDQMSIRIQHLESETIPDLRDEVAQNTTEAAKVALIQKDIEHIKKGQERIEALLERLR